MNKPTIQQAYTELRTWCRERDFAGYDPFDAMNSRLFQATPLKSFRFFRLGWTQLVKRSAVNLRVISSVPREQNAKGIALFALAALSHHRRSPTAETESVARQLLHQLLTMQIEGGGGATWGYNFDWQSRVLFAPRGTPTIVPTAFAARALVEAHQIFGDEQYLKTARSSGDFIVNNLPRTIDNADGLCFSYSPSSRTCVFNASLLAAETLATVGAQTGNDELLQLARRATRYVLKQQREDGSWLYGAGPGQDWIDNFHTAFVLSSLYRVLKSVAGDNASEIAVSLEHGYEFWRSRFFLADGCPKYYDDSLYPVDTHAAATAIATLADLSETFPDSLPLARKVARWSIDNLRDQSGYFYYQRRRFYTVRTPFMRWSEAWMLYGLARLLEAEAKGS